MEKLLRIALISIVLFSALYQRVYAAEPMILDAQVVETSDIREEEGLRMQQVTVEILEGEEKGSRTAISIPLEEVHSRPVKIGDKIIISLSNTDDRTIYQFYDFKRANSYIWLVLLFLIILLAFIGFKGLKTLTPSIILVLLILVGIIPKFFSLNISLIISILLVAFISAITAWIRLKSKLYTIIITFSAVVCVLIGLLIFVGFSQVAYVVPFLGSISTLNEEVYLKTIDVVIISIVFIPLGGILNSSIQLSKNMMEKYTGSKKVTISEMLKKGFRTSQKVSGGELNNLITIMIGISLVGLYFLNEQYPGHSMWNNGWVALQVIITISAGLSILMVSPIIVFISVGVSEWFGGKKKKVKGGQRRFKYVSES